MARASLIGDSRPCQVDHSVLPITEARVLLESMAGKMAEAPALDITKLI